VEVSHKNEVGRFTQHYIWGCNDFLSSLQWEFLTAYKWV
jgi:hypothetical protein